jgi:hypothetical protein
MTAMHATSRQINLQVGERDLKYYIFDWDDNILHMPTRIHLERLDPDGTWVPHLVSTAVFSVIRADAARYRPPNNRWPEAFVEFQDYAHESESAFLRDARQAIERVLNGEDRPAPSFATFRKTLVEGRLFAIVTARGHASRTLRKGVRLFVDLVLTPAEREQMLANLRGYRACFDHLTAFGTDDEELEYFLGLNHYHAVTSPDFTDLMAPQNAPAAESSEHRKQVAIRTFVEHLAGILTRTQHGTLRRPVSVGFSDDDPGNIAAAEQYIREELAPRFPGVKFCVYDTSEGTQAKARKTVVSGQLDLGL